MTVLPQFALPLTGAALGWIVAGVFIFRSRIPMEYQSAVKLLRKNKIIEAIDVIDDVIKNDPDTPNHYRFRAELLRLSGKLDKARRDYQRMTELAPDNAEAHNGLAEVYLQMGNTSAALDAALKAYELAPQEWVALYNLGMIEDRLNKWDGVLEHLHKALELRVPDTRHRLLIHLYLARAYTAKGDADNVRVEIDLIRKHKSGLEEWQKILTSEQATTLRAVIGDDVQMAQDIIDGKVTIETLAKTSKAEAR
jgi:tetratricopeptide (TPR) repeat protein